MHQDERRLKKFGKMFGWLCRSSLLPDDIVGVGDRLNMKLYAALTLAPDQTVSINSTALPPPLLLIYPMQLHPHYQLSNAGRQKLKM